MSKTRVHELAKKLGLENKELIEKLRKMDVEVKNHMSGLEDDIVAKVTAVYSKKDEKPAQKPAENSGSVQSKSQSGNQTSTQSSNQNRTQSNNQTRPQGSNQNRPQGNNQNRAQGSNQTRPQGSNQNRPQGANQNRPQGSNQAGGQNRAQGSNQNRPQGTNQAGGQNRPQGSNQNRPQGANGQNRTQGANGQNRPQGNFQNRNNQNRNNQNRPNGRFNNNQKNKNNNKKENAKPVEPVVEKIEEEILLISISDTITVKELAEKLHKKAADIVMALMKKGVMANINQEIPFETVEELCEEYDVIVEHLEEVDLLEEAFREEDDKEEDMVERPPVVVVMGHVDHGKTSLLDAIRHSSVTAKEAGGITQHIGAYTVSVNNKPITFLDTPGHEAFTAMRMRGAQVTDVAILVVAADDGVMPQTIEAINHAKAAGVEIIVAINKIDKPGANPDRVKQELVEYGLISEDWGGETICVPVSAVSKEGIGQLLEMIILVSEMKELRANPNKRARGNIIEAQLDKGRGSVATVLVQDGTLNVGDPVVAGTSYGKVRAMMNDKGQKVKKAGPSMPVEILGLNEVPMAGDMFYVARSEKHARQVAESVFAKGRVDMIKDTPQKVSLDDLFSQIQSGNIKELNIVIKADVQGSVEAVRASLEKLSNEEVRIRTIHGGVGAITESDVMLASASNAIVIGFNVRPEASAKSVADDQKVDVRLYRIIYNAIEDITAAMKGMLDPVFEEKIIGHAEIRQIFKASGVGTIGGSYVLDGKFVRKSSVRITRDGVVVYEGELATLKRFKEDVKEVNTGYECGLLFNKFNDIKEGDIVEAFVMEEIKQ